MDGAAIEQIAHALESLLDGLRRGSLSPAEGLFTACYHALDTIQLVQAAYEAGETTPPTQALLVLAEIEQVRAGAPEPVETALPSPTPGSDRQDPQALASLVKAARAPEAARSVQSEPHASPTSSPSKGGSSSGGDETVRVDVQKLDALMASLSELLIARIRLEQRQAQINQLRSMLDRLLKNWTPLRLPYNRLMREQLSGVLRFHRPRSVDPSPNGSSRAEYSLFRASLAVEPGLNGSENGYDWKHMVEVSKDSALLLGYIGESQEQINAISQQVSEMSQQHAADTLHLSLVIDELEDEIKRMRMLPLSTITGSFARMIRDLATQAGKEAALTLLGGNTEVDKRILEGIKDPLMHLLRNALDHGIEKPENRQAQGKPRCGQITLSTEQVGKDVLIRVSDDGAGLDLEAIRQAIRNQNAKSGVVSSAMSDADLTDAIFSIGVTTSRIITDVSGRGVGLNVVRSNIESLRGRVGVETRPGEGTTFTLTMPLVLTGSRCLLVRCAGQLFAIPIHSVERSLHVNPAQIFSLEGHDTLSDNGAPLPLVRLSDILQLAEKPAPTRSEKQRLSAVVMSIEERRFSRSSAQKVAFLIDELVGEQEVVIKSMGEHLARVAGIGGATVLGSGEVVLILNAEDLIKLAARPQPRCVVEPPASQAAPKENHDHKRVLVVDELDHHPHA